MCLKLTEACNREAHRGLLWKSCVGRGCRVKEYDFESSLFCALLVGCECVLNLCLLRGPMARRNENNSILKGLTHELTQLRLGEQRTCSVILNDCQDLCNALFQLSATISAQMYLLFFLVGVKATDMKTLC